MTRGSGKRMDVTAEAAVGNAAGDALLALVEKTLEDDLDQVLVLGHKALNLPFTYLARRLAIDRREAESRVGNALEALSRNAVLTEGLGNIDRAGQLAHFQALAFRLNLIDWLCAYCGQPLTQPRVGRPRRTCSPRCRRLLFEAGRTGRKESGKPMTPHGAVPRHDRMALSEAKDAGRDVLLKMITPVEQGEDRWSQPHARSRDLAVLLLGFACPLPVTPADLAALDFYDIGWSRNSMQVVLFRGSARPTRYVTITEDAAVTCPVQATLSWRERLARNGLASGPLFIELTGTGRLPSRARRLTAHQICEIISTAASRATRKPDPRIATTTSLSKFLARI